MSDNPLFIAAREVNAYASDHSAEQKGEGFSRTVQWLGMGDEDEIAHLAQQRSLRAIAAHDFGEAEMSEQRAWEILNSERYRAMETLLMITYMDGLTTGWRAHMLKDDRFGQGGRL